jgi:hypothetical protein
LSEEIPDGISIKINGVDIHISQNSVDALSDAWKSTLQWAGDYPLVYGMTIAGVILLVGVIQWGRRQSGMQKIEYQKEREGNEPEKLPDYSGSDREISRVQQ